MADLVEVIGQIRYQLSRLSAKNGHHEFEHLCRHLARLRICSNILPATGPVSAGGDQGRDFETFVTHLRESKVKSSFAGMASSGPVAFACTLQKKKGLAAKIKADVTTICQGTVKPVAVHFFSEVAVPTAKRHELQQESLDDHDVHLEVYDGEAIAELLSAKDAFWIAMRFLDVPADIYPTPTDLPEWYAQYRNVFVQDDLDKRNWGDFADLKSALRHATFACAFRPS